MNHQEKLRQSLQKALARVTIFLCLLSWNAPAFAATYYWVGADVSTIWTDPDNWSLFEKGARGVAGMPAAGDTAVFSYSGAKVTLASGTLVAGLELRSVWTGSLVLGSGTIAVGSTGITVASGSLISGTGNISTSGDFTQTGGIVDIQSTFSLSGSFLLQSLNTPGANFTSTGTIVFDGAADQIFEVVAGAGTGSFTNLTIDNSGGTTDDDVRFSGSTLALSGSLLITLGNLDLTGWGGSALITESGVVLADNADASLSTKSNMTVSGAIFVGDAGILSVSGGTLTLNGDSDQDIDLDGQKIHNLTINNTGTGTRDDIILAGGELQLSGSLLITQGNLEMVINSTALTTESGVVLADNANASLSTKSNMTVSGAIFVGNASIFSVSGGTLTLNGTQDQSIDLDGQKIQNLTLNNAGGGTRDDIILAGGELQLSGSLLITLGNLDLAANSIALTTESGVVIASNAQSTLSTDANITASGTDISTGASGTFTMSGSAILLLNSYEGMNLDVNGALIPNLTISTGSTTLKSDLRVGGTLRINSGATLNLSTFTLGATGSTIINYATLTEGTGKLVHTGSTVLITDSSYAEQASFNANNSETVYFTMTDSDENIDGTAIDTVLVTISVNAGDFETITLTETTNTSGIFRGNIGTGVGGTVSDGVLKTSSPTNFDFVFTDAQDDLSSTDSALLDGQASGGGSTARRRASIAATSGGGGGGAEEIIVPLEEGVIEAVEEVVEEIIEVVEEVVEEVQAPVTTLIGGPLPEVRGRLEVTLDGKAVVLSDVPVDSWFARFIATLIAKGIASGYRDARGRITGEFGAPNNVTYAEIAKMALIAAGKNTVDTTPRNRSARGQWSSDYIATLEALGVSIFSDTSLNVNDYAPRGAVIQILLEVFNVRTSSATGNLYSDVSANAKHAAAIEQATYDNVVSGDSGASTFRPRHPINRAETAKMIVNAMMQY